MAARWVASARPFRPASSSAGRQTTDGTCLAQPEGRRGAHAQPRGVRGQDDARACSPVDPGQLGRACPLEQARPAPAASPLPQPLQPAARRAHSTQAATTTTTSTCTQISRTRPLPCQHRTAHPRPGTRTAPGTRTSTSMTGGPRQGSRSPCASVPPPASVRQTRFLTLCAA